MVTKYDLTHSGVPRSKYDLEVYITSLSKKNQEMDQLDRKIKSFDNLCISPELKEQLIKEVEQLRQSIIYSSSHLNFFWQHDTMVSFVRVQVYDLWDMIGNDYNLLLLLVNYLSFLFLNCSWLWWIYGLRNRIIINFNNRTNLLDICKTLWFAKEYMQILSEEVRNSKQTL